MSENREVYTLRELIQSMLNVSAAVAVTVVKRLNQEAKKVFGLVVCVGLFLAGFVLSGNIGLYFNLAAILIVIGGTFGAGLICFQVKRLLIVYKVLVTSYQSKVKEPEEIVEILVDLSVKSKLKGLLSLEEDGNSTSLSFLRRALGLLVDGYNGEQIRDILQTEMYFFRLRREESERVLRTLAEICPAYGLVGSVVGLVGLLSGVVDKSTILETVPIALISTLYGVILAYFFFLPFANNIRERTDQELLLQKIITDGILAIQCEVNPRVLEAKLKSFLTPSERDVRLVSLERIRERFNLQPTPPRPVAVRQRSVPIVRR